ncbi:hypothetical protein JL722_2275 [Aureococcus anophagefferens]|nr:hypothetical protein JL722_2275 [Aureococcus anophagefferens]
MADGDLAAAAAAMLKKDADDDDHVSVGSGLSSDEEDAAPRKPAGGASQSEERKRLIAEKMSRIGGAKGGSAFAPPARRRLDAPDATTSSMAAAADELRKALGGEGDDDEPPSPAKSKRSSLGSPAARASPTRDLTADTLDKAARTLLGEKTDATSEALNRAARTLSPTKELDGSRRSSPTKGLEAAARRVASPTPPDVEADLERAARALSTPDDLEAAARKLAEEEKKRGGGTDDDDVAAAAVALAEAEPDAPRVVVAAGDVVDAKFRGAWAPATVLGAAKESSKKGAGYDVRYDDGGVVERNVALTLASASGAARRRPEQGRAAGARRRRRRPALARGRPRRGARRRDGRVGRGRRRRGAARRRSCASATTSYASRARGSGRRGTPSRAAAAASRQLRSFLLSKGPRTRDQLLAAFKDADADGSGVVDRGEFRALLEDAGLVVDETRATAAAATETVGVRVDASFKLDLDQATTAIIVNRGDAGDLRPGDEILAVGGATLAEVSRELAANVERERTGELPAGEHAGVEKLAAEVQRRVKAAGAGCALTVRRSSPGPRRARRAAARPRRRRGRRRVHEDLVAFALEDAPRDGDAELAVVADAAAAALRGPARASGVPDPGAAWDRLRKAARADAKKATLDASALKKHLGTLKLPLYAPGFGVGGEQDKTGNPDRAPSPGQAAAVVRRCLDPSGDGAVTLAEFAAFAFWPPRPAPDVKRGRAAATPAARGGEPSPAAALFRALDRDGNGASAARSSPSPRGAQDARRRAPADPECERLLDADAAKPADRPPPPPKTGRKRGVAGSGSSKIDVWHFGEAT